MARSKFSVKQLHSCGVPKQLRMLADAGVVYAHADAQFRMGILVKRELFQKQCVDFKSGDSVEATRSRFVWFVKAMPFDDQEGVEDVEMSLLSKK